jgi:2-oxoglutarate ferredoxin oxidoreductase subunit beta
MPVLNKKDFQSDQEVRWCPGCGDYSILKAVQLVLPELGVPKENFVVVSGIGCSSRFPYYMNTYGFHGIHGRAPAIASGLKIARPDLEVWVATGDGDAMSIGGNHLIHLLRRNIGIKVVMFNNRIYGLTKGQYSPTSERGKRTKSTPYGSLDNPFNPLSLALGAGATFVARTVDIFQKHMNDVLTQAAAHKGSAFVEIYQNCNIFNDRAFAYMTDKDSRDDQTLYVEDGKPLVFGADGSRGLKLSGTSFEVVEAGDDCLVWKAGRQDPSMAFMLGQLGPPNFPTPIGVFRAVDEPIYERDSAAQIESAIESQGQGKLEELIYSGEMWTVAADGSVERPA